jgi:hypothetical protein
MSATKVLCRSCLRTWALPLAATVYAQQALESCPCPFCGAYTLSCIGSESEALDVKQAHLGFADWVDDALGRGRTTGVLKRL